jgi:hypothetical protein
LIFLFGLAFLYFYSGGGPNQAVRFNLDRAILEHGTVQIDRYQKNTEDKAYYNGHYYCDKAPGSSLFALPALAVSRTILRQTGIDTDGASAAEIQIRVATWFGAGLPATVLCLVVYGWLRRKGHSNAAAVYSSIAVGLASPMWAYATLFWGNALASCCLVIAARLVDRLVHSVPGEKTLGLAFGAGAAAGGAVITEYPTVPMAAFLALFLAWHLRDIYLYGRQLLLFGAGALLIASVLGSYNYIAFGSPFHVGYASVQGFEGMKQGMFGVTWPSMVAVEGVVWGPRGILLTGPVVVLGLFGHVYSLIVRRHRKTAIIALFCSIYPFLLNVSYVYWDGGWTYGPRHMAAALPFLAMGLAPLYGALQVRLRPLAVLVLAAGAFVCLMGVSVHGMTPLTPPNPLPDLYWPSFWLGWYARNSGWHGAGGPASNFGLAMGLDLKYSLVPFFVGSLLIICGLAHSVLRAPSKES